MGPVQNALDLLRNQELAHHTDPITAPQPYLSSLQLRDLSSKSSLRTRLARRKQVKTDFGFLARENLFREAVCGCAWTEAKRHGLDTSI